MGAIASLTFARNDRGWFELMDLLSAEWPRRAAACEFAVRPRFAEEISFGEGEATCRENFRRAVNLAHRLRQTRKRVEGSKRVQELR